jgi:hypothetical protein
MYIFVGDFCFSFVVSEGVKLVMRPKKRVAAACKAMKRVGIPEDEVKPALNQLLELYNNKWTLIEEDDYKVLLDVLLEKKHEEDKVHLIGLY